MKRLFLIALAAVGLSFFIAAGSHAAVIERDLVPGSGDGLLTFDTVNQREWLDLSETLLIQYPGASLEERYQSVVAELDDGGMFAGFTVAKSDDVVALAESAGIDTGTLDFGTNELPTQSLIALLGPTLNFPSASGAVGFLDELSPPPPSIRRIGADFLINPESGATGIAGLLISASDDALGASTAGVMLYRVVPEPSSTILVLLCVVAFGFHRRS